VGQRVAAGKTPLKRGVGPGHGCEYAIGRVRGNQTGSDGENRLSRSIDEEAIARWGEILGGPFRVLNRAVRRSCTTSRRTIG
jgi:hypothetical protein